MAEAFAKRHSAEGIAVYSAGSHPSGKINEKAIGAMLEIGYDLSVHLSKGLDRIPQIEYDVVVTMGCGDACPAVRGKRREDWEIPDPKGLDAEGFAKIRDLIRDKTRSLIARLSRQSR